MIDALMSRSDTGTAIWRTPMHAALRTAGDLTPALMTELLRLHDPQVVVSSVRIRGVEQGANAHVSLTVTYENQTTELPFNLFVKTQLDAREVFSGELSDALGGTGDMLSVQRAETRFYNEIRPALDIEAPVVYAAAYVQAPTQFILVAEDLGDRGAQFRDPAVALSPERTASLLDALAGLHAPMWNDPRIADDGEFGWADTPLAGGFSNFIRTRTFIDSVATPEMRAPTKSAMLASTGLDEDRFWRGVWRLQEFVADAPVTLLHGDAHLGNTYLLPDGRCGLVDWTLIRRASWVHDVSYTMISALSTEDRRVHEKDLLNGYFDELRRLGVDPPDRDHAWRLWRAAPLWGFLMWVATPYEMYSPDKVDNTLMRFASAIADHDSCAALGVERS